MRCNRFSHDQMVSRKTVVETEAAKLRKMASGTLKVKITLYVILQIFVSSSVADECLYKCKDFAGEEVCITDFLLCDHFPHCENGLDETNCGCRGFTCKSDGMCEDSSKECDGFANCFDRSDEVNCTKSDYKRRFPSLPVESLCKKPCGRHGSCVFLSDEDAVCFCDMGYHGTFCEIPNEKTAAPQTSKASELPEETFTCDGKKIPRKLYCDGRSDCDDKTDEVNCTMSDYRKAKPHVDPRFLCLMPCVRSTCTFDHAYVAHCPCPDKAEGVFCEKWFQKAPEPPMTTSSTESSIIPNTTRPNDVTKVAVEGSHNFFTTVALPVIAVAGLALALWLWIAKPWTAGGPMGRPLV